MKIRLATSRDSDAIGQVHLDAFPADEGESVAKLAVELLAEKTQQPVISLVAETAGAVVAHVAFSPVTVEGDERFQGHILAPLGVKSDFQKQQLGSRLVEHGIQQLSASGVNVILVYGDPAYYGRFGFSADAAAPYHAPYKLQYPFGWQALVLNQHQPERSPVTIRCVAALCDQGLW